MECEVCKNPEDVPLRDCDVCRRKYHFGLCGGFYQRFETDISDFDPDDYMRGQTAARSARRHEDVKRICIICRANNFGQHGVPPGPRQWQKALVAYDLNRVVMQRRFRPDPWAQAFDERKTLWQEMEAARKNHFSQLEPFKVQKREAESSLNDIKQSYVSAKAKRDRAGRQFQLQTDLVKTAIEEHDRLIARWLELRAERRLLSDEVRELRRKFDQIGFNHKDCEIMEIEERGRWQFRECEQLVAQRADCLALLLALEDEIQHLAIAMELGSAALHRTSESYEHAQIAVIDEWWMIKAATSSWSVFPETIPLD